MIADVRTYTLFPRKLNQYLKLVEQYALPVMRAHGMVLDRYFISKIGPLNQVVHIWNYENLSELERIRNARDADPKWAKYLSKMFNDHWMIDNGFIEREKHNNLRDLIARRHIEKEDFVLAPSIPLNQAIKRMRMYDVSQMVVIEDSKVVGLIDESDVLIALVQNNDNANRPVSDFMTRRLQTLTPEASINDLVPIFRADRVAIVMDDENYYGLITKIDLINYLRQQLL